MSAASKSTKTTTSTSKARARKLDLEFKFEHEWHDHRPNALLIGRREGITFAELMERAAKTQFTKD